MSEDPYKDVNTKINGVYDYWGKDTSFVEKKRNLSEFEVKKSNPAYLESKVNRYLYRKYASS